MSIPAGQHYGMFCVEIDYERGSESPSRVFRAMTDLIETFEAFDKDLVRSVDPSIETVALIENIEAGSIRAWLANALRISDDDALKNLDWKPQVGKYLVKAKYLAIKYLEGKTEILSKEEVDQLESDILKVAVETDVAHIPAYTAPNRRRLLLHIEKLSASLTYLHREDRAYYETPEEKIEMNKEFSIVPETIDQLLTRETLSSSQTMILKVKKPDYLGESRWDLRHGTRVISVKIRDQEWLDRFQSRKIDVRPGDSLRAQVEIKVMYGYDNEVVNTQYEVMKVIEILRTTIPEQLKLEPPNDESNDED